MTDVEAWLHHANRRWRNRELFVAAVCLLAAPAIFVLTGALARSWGVVDAVTAVVYRQPDGRPASARDLASHPEWIDLHRRGEETPYTTREQFRGVAISSHDVDADARLPSPVVPPNAYTRSILAEGERGWPGGLRWLHGEDGPG
jgi:hypothetical protein